ncbi:triple functional domain protein-like isoform X1 [Tachysurus ichikawai]
MSNCDRGNVGCFRNLIDGFNRNEEMKAMEVLPILKEKVAFLSGGRDRRGGPVLTFPARSNHDRIRQEDLRRLIAYLAGIPRSGFTSVSISILFFLELQKHV